VPTFQFPLESVLRLRTQQERHAEAELMRARVKLDGAKAKEFDLRQRLALLSDDLKKCLGRTMVGSELGAQTERIARMEKAIESAAHAVREAAAAAQTAEQHWKEIAAEVEGMETLREKYRDEFRLEQLKKDQDRIDEAGLRQWMALAAETE
jgi:flagellar export protein FliJ